MGLSKENQMKAQEDGSQAADGGCCRVSNPPENAVKLNLERKVNGGKKRGIKNKISTNVGKNGAPEQHKVCTMPTSTWLETWESQDAYAALALIGAAVSVAVAYNCYRQLG